MSIRRVPSTRHPGSRSRLLPLAAALALAGLAAPLAAATAQTTHIVTTCDDPPGLPVCDGDNGTLRQALFCAGNGDRVDMTQLQCSKITLSDPLIVGPIGLDIDGPGRDRLTIDAGGNFRALVHNGQPKQRLTVRSLTITNGRYDNPYSYGGGGGCIYSSGDLSLSDSVVSSCYASAVYTVAKGGAIFVKGSASVARSTVTGSTAAGFLDTKKYTVARGGGIYADSVSLSSSTVTDNVASSPYGATDGGGVHAGEFLAKYSTIANNQARNGGGVVATTSFALANSTISGNNADYIGGAALAAADPVEIYNSTIAFNAASIASSVGGIGATSIVLQSSIVARNTAGDAPSDIIASAGITGSNNLIVAPLSAVPADTFSEDPLLGPLQDNGGSTWTHAPAPYSPAIDHGNSPWPRISAPTGARQETPRISARSSSTEFSAMASNGSNNR